MQKLVILAALVACCLAMPRPSEKSTHDILQRPAPINPDVQSAPKPAEKITKITDPKEIAKHKRETVVASNQQPLLLPTTIAPQLHHSAPSSEEENNHKPEHHRQKREQQPPVTPSKHTNDDKHDQTAKAEKHRQQRDVAHLQLNEPVSSSTLASVPSIYHDQAVQAHAAAASSVNENQNGQVQGYTQTYHSLSVEHPPAKRDIPVPLVAKHQPQSEEADNKSEEKNGGAKHEDKKESIEVKDTTEHTQQHKRENTETTAPIAPNTSQESNEHPAIRRHPVPVAELFAHSNKSQESATH